MGKIIKDNAHYQLIEKECGEVYRKELPHRFYINTTSVCEFSNCCLMPVQTPEDGRKFCGQCGEYLLTK